MCLVGGLFQVVVDGPVIRAPAGLYVASGEDAVVRGVEVLHGPRFEPPDEASQFLYVSAVLFVGRLLGREYHQVEASVAVDGQQQVVPAVGRQGRVASTRMVPSLCCPAR